MIPNIVLMINSSSLPHLFPNIHSAQAAPFTFLFTSIFSNNIAISKLSVLENSFFSIKDKDLTLMLQLPHNFYNHSYPPSALFN